MKILDKILNFGLLCILETPFLWKMIIQKPGDGGMVFAFTHSFSQENSMQLCFPSFYFKEEARHSLWENIFEWLSQSQSWRYQVVRITNSRSLGRTGQWCLLQFTLVGRQGANWFCLEWGRDEAQSGLNSPSFSHGCLSFPLWSFRKTGLL